MAKPHLHHYYLAPRWRAVRRVVFERAGHACERCREAGRIGPAMIVHHVPELETLLAEGKDPYEPQFLQAVCRQCHADAHQPDPDTLAWSLFVRELIPAHKGAQ